jgi:UDP-glucose 4-epimerase
LRYFNVVGNSQISAFDVSRFNLLPNLYRAIKNKNIFEIYGKDYETTDGTCIRDYVDVNSITKAHFDAYEKMDELPSCFSAYNLGSGDGISVEQIARAAQRVISPELEYIFLPRRAGDPAKIYADTTKAKKELGWKNEASLEEMLLSGWNAWNRGNLN